MKAIVVALVLIAPVACSNAKPSAIKGLDSDNPFDSFNLQPTAQYQTGWMNLGNFTSGLGPDENDFGDIKPTGANMPWSIASDQKRRILASVAYNNPTAEKLTAKVTMEQYLSYTINVIGTDVAQPFLGYGYSQPHKLIDKEVEIPANQMAGDSLSISLPNDEIKSFTAELDKLPFHAAEGQSPVLGKMAFTYEIKVKFIGEDGSSRGFGNILVRIPLPLDLFPLHTEGDVISVSTSFK